MESETIQKGNNTTDSPPPCLSQYHVKGMRDWVLNVELPEFEAGAELSWITGLCAKIRECEKAAENGDLAARMFPWGWMNPVHIEFSSDFKNDEMYEEWMRVCEEMGMDLDTEKDECPAASAA